MQKLFWVGVALLVLTLTWLQSSTAGKKAGDGILEETYTKETENEPVLRGPKIHIGEKKPAPSRPIEDARIVGGTVAKVPIMIYHSVRPHIEGESRYQEIYDVSPELFEEELKLIQARGYTTISFADLESYLKEQKPLPAKAIILSFDDGWKNQYLYAFPLLKQYKMKGTFFIFSGAISSRSAFMNWAEIAEMHAAGMEIQGHSYTHPVLTHVQGAAALKRELAFSKAQIEEHTKSPVNAFAYPFGMYNANIIDAVAGAGYHIARTTKDSVWHSSKRMFTISGTLSTDSIADFAALLDR
jgi:peptidoglycan/xylan/chitin deacetylase (PgdA/CDA1 family)